MELQLQEQEKGKNLEDLILELESTQQEISLLRKIIEVIENMIIKREDLGEGEVIYENPKIGASIIVVPKLDNQTSKDIIEHIYNIIRREYIRLLQRPDRARPGFRRFGKNKELYVRVREIERVVKELREINEFVGRKDIGLRVYSSVTRTSRSLEENELYLRLKEDLERNRVVDLNRYVEETHSNEAYDFYILAVQRMKMLDKKRNDISREIKEKSLGEVSIIKTREGMRLVKRIKVIVPAYDKIVSFIYAPFAINNEEYEKRQGERIASLISASLSRLKIPIESKLLRFRSQGTWINAKALLDYIDCIRDGKIDYVMAHERLYVERILI